MVRADVSIALYNESDSDQPFTGYDRIDFFTTRYANTNGTSTTGYLHQPQVNDGCSYIPRVPNATAENWIALIEGYPSCEEDMITYVRNAGYVLILASSPNDTQSHLTRQTRNSHFPIVLIKDEYMQYLLENGQSDFENPQVSAEIGTDMIVFIFLCVLIFTAALLMVCCTCCGCYLWCRARRRRRRFEWEIRNIQQRQRNYNVSQNRERVARQELIESILRQLQQLQLDSETQRPLGAERTQQLPTQRYSKVESVDGPAQEACAICVDDFQEGDNMRVLPCNHHFHLKCIDEWLINHSDLCPLCKKQLPRGDEEGRGGAGRRRGRGADRDLVLFTDEDSFDSDDSVLMERPRDRLIGPGQGGGGGGMAYGSV